MTKRRAIPLLPFQAECLRQSEPIICGVLEKLGRPSPDLAHKLAIAGCVGLRRWRFDPDERKVLEQAHAALVRLADALAALSPAALGAIDATKTKTEKISVLTIRAALPGLLEAFDSNIDKWPRRPNERPAKADTELVFRLWPVLQEHGFSMRAGARCIAAIFSELGILESTADPDRYADSIYQRIRNAGK